MKPNHALSGLTQTHPAKRQCLKGNFLSLRSALAVGVLLLSGSALPVLAQSPAPCAPTLLGALSPQPKSSDVVVAGTVAYVGDGLEGLKVVDIADPANPVLIGSLGAPNYTGGGQLAVSGNLLYSTVYGPSSGIFGIRIIDITNPANPLVVGSLNTPQLGRPSSIAVQGTTAFIADQLLGLIVVDVSNPTIPTIIGSANVTQIGNSKAANKIVVSGSLAYVSTATTGGLPGDGNEGFNTFDISDPTNPTLLGYGQMSFDTFGIALSDNVLYLGDNFGLIRSFDVSNPSAPVLLDSLATGLGVNDIAISGNRAFVAGTGGLRIFDISNPSNMALVSSTSLPGAAGGVAIQDLAVYVANQQQGLVIFDGSSCLEPLNAPPVAQCNDITVSAGCGSQADASIDNGSSDPDGDEIVVVQSPAGPYPLGQTTVTLTVTDPSGESDSCQAVVTVVQDLFAADAIVWHQPLARKGMSEDTDPGAEGTLKYRFKLGSTIPIKVHAEGCNGDVTANANVTGTVAVFGDTDMDGVVDGNEFAIDYNDVGAAGGVMDKVDGLLKYNLDTKSLPVQTSKCYILQVTLTDSSTGETSVELLPLQAK